MKLGHNAKRHILPNFGNQLIALSTTDLRPLNCPKLVMSALKVTQFSLDPHYHWINQNIDSHILGQIGSLV